MTEPDSTETAPALYITLLLAGAIFIGAVLGAITLSSLVYSSDIDETEETILPPRTAMQTLNDFRCLKAETKTIILRGVEDNYAATGEEIIPYGPVHEYLENRAGKKSAVTWQRQYDEGGMDKFLLDRIEVSSRVTQGLLVIKARSLSELNNDTIAIGELSTRHEKSNGAGIRFSAMAATDHWSIEGEVYSTRLSDIDFNAQQKDDGSFKPADYEDVLDFVQSSDKATRIVDVQIGDDHIVDVIGLAVCEPPKEARGMTLLVRSIKGYDGVVSMSCVKDNGEDHCDPYKGDALCSVDLPMACFRPLERPMPESIAQSRFSKAWSGGEVKFTPPIRGDAFNTQDEAHNYCSKTFGDGYRMATHQEHINPGISFLASGTADAAQAWIYAKTEPYGNCWSIITDYQAVEN